MGILRVPRDNAEMLGGAMFFVKEIAGQECALQIIHTGGTIKHCQQHAILYNRKFLLEMKERGLCSEQKIQELLTKAEKDIAAMME